MHNLVTLMAALALSGAHGFVQTARFGGELGLSRRGNLLAARITKVMPKAVAAAVQNAKIGIDLSHVQFSGLKGLALEQKVFPSKKEVLDVIPVKCFEKNTAVSMTYAAISVALTLACFSVGWNFIPIQVQFLPVWALYATVTGTVATGCWVIAHECGHGAFSNNKLLQDTVGYILHTALLVPYMSWQRSHAVHHAFTNHMTLGETHVPATLDHGGREALAQRDFLIRTLGEGVGGGIFAASCLTSHLVFGWPAYLLVGATGGPARGMTNHFWPVAPFSTGNKNTELFPGIWKKKVCRLDPLTDQLDRCDRRAGMADVMKPGLPA
jgi:hypothetical protein